MKPPSSVPIVVGTPTDFRRLVLDVPGPVLAMFFARWCPFCRSFRPIFQGHVGKAGVRFVEVDISSYDNPLWEDYHIEVVPSLILFQTGRTVARIDGIGGVGLKEADIEAILGATPP